jgi:hypothetical protein
MWADFWTYEKKVKLWAVLINNLKYINIYTYIFYLYFLAVLINNLNLLIYAHTSFISISY